MIPWTFFPKYLFLTVLLIGGTVVQSAQAEESAKSLSGTGSVGNRCRATASLMDICATAEATRQKLRSLRIEYKGTIAARGKSQDRTGTTRTVAAKGQCRYVTTAKSIGDTVIYDDYQIAHSFYDGRSWNAFFPFNRFYETSRRFADPEHTLKVRGEAYLECLAWWPPDDTSEPPTLDGRRFFLHEVLKKEPCRVLAEQEWIDGRWCHVIEVPGYDRIWLDKSGLVVQRYCYQGDERRPIMRYELSDFRSVAPNIQLPYSVRRVQYSVRDWDVLYDMHYRVIHCEANSVPESQFSFTPGPGTIIYDRDTDTVTQVPGGLDLIELSAARVSQRISGSAPIVGTHPLSVGISMTAGLVAGCLFYLSLRKLRIRSRNCRIATTIS
jgi:hypothetical protein